MSNFIIIRKNYSMMRSQFKQMMTWKWAKYGKISEIILENRIWFLIFSFVFSEMRVGLSPSTTIYTSNFGICKNFLPIRIYSLNLNNSNNLKKYQHKTFNDHSKNTIQDISDVFSIFSAYKLEKPQRQNDNSPSRTRVLYYLFLFHLQ